MRVLLLGPNGQLGHDIRSAHEEAGEPFELLPLARDRLDVSVSGAVERVLDEFAFDALVNCTSYHKTDEVEDNATLAFAVNAHAVHAMARACAAKRARFFHVSTDYVFGGDVTRAQPLREEDPPSPLNVYGASKAVGETLARRTCEDAVILRVASLFGVAGPSGKSENFVDTIIRLGQEKEVLRVVDDQVMSPTTAVDVARLVLRMLMDGCAPDLYHVVNTGSASWFEFAREIVRRAGIHTTVAPCTSAEYPTRAVRPRYSVLDNGKVSAAFGPMPPWQDALERYLSTKANVTSQIVPTVSSKKTRLITFADRYFLMTTDQAPPSEIAEWLRDPLFAAYVLKHRLR